MTTGSRNQLLAGLIDGATRPFNSWALDQFYRGFFADPVLTGFYGDSGYANLGYWDATATTAPQACDRLVDRLVEMLGPVPRDNPRVLDVACGSGATTHRLATHFGDGGIVGINISPSQLEVAAERVPGASFRLMDATALDFPDNSFDAVVCVEAAFHFDTRLDFLAEAHRVLKPGGAIALSDLLMVRGAPTIPSANFLEDRSEYATCLERIGFDAVVVEPAMDETLNGFRLNFSDHITANRQANGWLASTRDLYFTNLTLPATIRDAVLASARTAAP